MKTGLRSSGTICLTAGILALSGLLPAPAHALTAQQQRERCFNQGNAFSSDQQISACSEAIQSGRLNNYDLGTAYYISDRILIMNKGRAVESGDARTVLDNPQHPYSILLKSAVLSPDPTAREHEFT